MKIINLNDFLTFPLTVDNTNITVDNTNITVDTTTLTFANNLFIKVIPREYPNIVKIRLYNELKQTTVEDEVEVIINNGYMTIPLDIDNFKEGDSFEVTVFNLTDTIIWRGKAYVTNSTDLQNYKLNEPKDINKRIIKI